MLAPTKPRNNYIGDGSGTDFDFGFKIHTPEDVDVVKYVGGVQTTLTYGVHYTLPAEGLNNDDGGHIVLADDLEDGAYLALVRSSVEEQASEFRNLTRPRYDLVEQTFDRLVMIDQQQQDQINSAIRLPLIEDPDDFSMTLPIASVRANKLLAFDGNGDLEVVSTAPGGGSSTEIIADEFEGDASEQMNAAIASAVAGDVVNARGCTGTAAYTVEINKRIKLIIPRGVVWSVYPAYFITSDAIGATLEGDGPGVTVWTPAVGGPAVQVEGHDTLIHHFGIEFPSPAAGNIGVNLQADAGVGNLLRPHLDDLDINGAGYRTLEATTGNQGDGIREGILFVATITRCYIHGFYHGRFLEDHGFSSTTTTFVSGTRIYDNTVAVKMEGGSYWGHNNVIEGNAHYGIWITGDNSFSMKSDHEYFENPVDEFGVSGAPTSIRIEGLAVNPYARILEISGAVFSNPPGTGWDVYLGDGIQQYLYINDSPMQCGLHVGAGQPIAKTDNSFGLGEIKREGGQTSSYTTSYSEFWTGYNDAVVTIDGWTNVFFTNEFDETGPTTKSYVQFSNTVQTTGNYAGTFQGTVLGLTVNPEQSDDLTGLASAATVSLNLFGSGEMTTMWAQFNQVSQSYIGETWSAVISYTVGNYVTYGSPQHTYKSKTVGNLNHAPPNATHWEDLGEAGHVTGGAAIVARVANHTESTWDQAIAMFIYPAVNDGGGTLTDYTALAIADTPDRTGITNYYAFRTFGGTVQNLITEDEYFWVFTSVDPNALKVSGEFGTIGMGAPPDSAIKLFVNSSWTDTGTVDVGLANNTAFAPTANRTVASFGHSMTTYVASGNTRNFSAVFEGLYNSTEHRGTGVMSDVRGEVLTVSNASTGTMTLARGLQIGIVNGAGATIGTSWTLLLDPPSNAGTWTTHYGEQITMPTSGTFTNLAGLYITTPAGATCAYPYAMITDGGHVAFNSTGGAYDFVISTDHKAAAFALTGSTDALSIDTTSLGFYGVAVVTRPTAYTQTYATADKTHADATSADIGAFTGGAVGFLDAAERDNVRTQYNALRADVLDVKQLVNSVIDDLQALGLLS